MRRSAGYRSLRGYRNGGEIGFRDIAGEEGRLGTQEEKIACRALFLFRRELEGDGWFPGVEVGKKFVYDRDLGLGGFRPGADFLLQAIVPFLEGSEISQNQLGVDHLDVADRIDRATNVMNIGVLEATDHLDNRVYLADVAEELVTETLAGARPFHESRDIHELDRGRDDLLRVREFGERFEAGIGNGNDAEVRDRWCRTDNSRPALFGFGSPR